MVENIRETKELILQSCQIPKNWAELLEITGKVSSTLSVHVTDLMEKGLLARNEGLYSTTQRGVETLRLVPYVRTIPEGKTPKELVNMVHIGFKPTILTLKENLKFELGGLIGIKHDRTLKKIYENVVKTITKSVTVWLPHGLVPDKAIYKEVNRLISIHTKRNPDAIDDKITILIEFDLKKALDMVIYEEQDPEIKNRLVENRERILKKIYKNWHKLVK